MNILKDVVLTALILSSLHLIFFAFCKNIYFSWFPLLISFFPYILQTYVKAVREGVKDLEAVLCSPESQQQLVALGPQLVANTSKSRKTIDSEDTQKRCLAQEDGTLVTESKKTTEHELILDGDEEEARPGDELLGEQLITTAASQRYFKQRDEQHVDLLADGKLVATEMRYAAETQQMEKDGSLERPGDWDSLSDRMRKLRRTQQQQQQKGKQLL